MNLEWVEERIDFIEHSIYYDAYNNEYMIEELIHWKEQVAKWSIYNGHGLEYEFEQYNG